MSRQIVTCNGCGKEIVLEDFDDVLCDECGNNIWMDEDGNICQECSDEFHSDVFEDGIRTSEAEMFEFFGDPDDDDYRE